MLTWKYFTTILSVHITLHVATSSANETDTCENLRLYHLQNYYSRDIYLYYLDFHFLPDVWYNTSFWGGNELIAWKDNIASHCWNSYSSDKFLVLSEKHPDTLNLTDDVYSMAGCIMNQSGACVESITVDIRKCDEDVLYRFQDVWFTYWRTDVYICFDRIYNDKCDISARSLPANVIENSDSLVNLEWSDIGTGWYDMFFDGKNYTLPSTKAVDYVAERYYGQNGLGLYLQGPFEFVKATTGLRVCQITELEYETNFDESKYDCAYHIFVRSCNGKLLFDLSLLVHLEVNTCLIRTDNVKILPEIRHNVQKMNVGDKTYNQYDPYLQYRCSFQVSEGYLYEVKWYINGVYLLDKGPTSDIENLVLNENELTDQTLGYEVKCSVLMSRNESDNETLTIESDDFYAGYKFSDTSLRVSNLGYTPVSVRLTVPKGCSYNDLSPAICEEPLTLVDTSNTGNGKSKRSDGLEDTCKAGVQALNAYDRSRNYQMVKSLRMGEELTGQQTFKYDLMTIDDTYQDSDRRSASVEHIDGGIASLNPTVKLELLIDMFDYNKERMCYSHCDPHMRTADGKYYEQQREGDYMLYKHMFDEIEVQERARKCDHGSKAICACGVVVRSGKDAFTINRCDKPFKIDFIQCGDCGILDVVKRSDYRYDIFTPKGTRISIELLKYFGNGRNMDIDIYLGIKDYQQTAGLCGFFDGDRSNDFRLRDKSERPGNEDYLFSSNWRLQPSENLFNNPNRGLRKMNTFTRKCFRLNSITEAKCHRINPSCPGRRRKREFDEKVLHMIHNVRELPGNIRSKRDTDTIITTEQAEEICKSAVNSTPAVQEFPDQLANENLNNVTAQCVYDVTVTNDASWAKAHTIALNNIATNILNLKPIFKSNNSGVVETFLKHTCINNCSNNGECSKEGLCECSGVYRGADCSFDIRIPPLIEDVTDGGNCDATGETECRCFVIHTNNIFEGFKYDITTFKMTFNGSRFELGRSTDLGEYGDLYTGEGCVHVERTKRNDFEFINFIHTYDVSISNNGINFSDIRSVYVYDETCLQLVWKDDIISSVELKNGYCFIDDTCVIEGYTYVKGTETKCCNPHMNIYTWTAGDCEEDVGLTTAALVGIIAGCCCAVIAVTVVVVCMKCYRPSKKRRTIAVENANRTQTECIKHIVHKDDAKIQTAKQTPEDYNNASDWSPVLPDLTTPGAAKPLCTRNLYINSQVGITETSLHDRQSITPFYENVLPGLGDDTSLPDVTDNITGRSDDGQKSLQGLSAVSLKID